ncbi:MAG TPA: spore germination protein GerW family protein [Anaerolineae bacterium]|nr:spore germination protein GerW family protein [Anaerolineae bacterium]
MPLNRLFDTIQQLRDSAHWRSAFGDPQTVGERTIIPVASVWYGFGFGFGQPAPAQEQPRAGDEPELLIAGEGTEGGGAGGGGMSRPVGAIVITGDDVYFEEAGSYNKVALAGIGLAGWIIFQVALTLRAVFGRR